MSVPHSDIPRLRPLRGNLTLLESDFVELRDELDEHAEPLAAFLLGHLWAQTNPGYVAVYHDRRTALLTVMDG